MSSAQKPQQSTLVKIVFFLVLVAAVSSTMYSGMPVISIDSAKERAKAIADYLAADAARDGRQASVAYDDVKIEGWGYDKYVTIDNMGVTFASKPGAGSWSIVAPKTNVALDPLYSRRQIFRFTDTLILSENGKKTATVNYTTPIRFGFLGGLETPVQSMRLTIRLPNQFTVMPEPTADNATPQPMNISYDGFPEIDIHNVPVTGEREAKYEFRNIMVDSGGKTQYTIGALANNFSEKTGEDKQVDGQFSFTVSDFTMHGDGRANTTCSLTTNLSYKSDVSLMSLLGIPTQGAIEMKVNKLLFACEEFSIRLEGNLARVAGDPVPTGDMKLTIENVKAFLASSLISSKTRSELVVALPKYAGQPLDSITSLSVPVKRDKNGTLQIGKSSLDEANITVVSEQLQALHPSEQHKEAAPEPAAKEPAAKPAKAKPAAKPTKKGK